MLIEVCVDRVQSALSAEKGGADRIELCQDLLIGGTTPSKGLVIQTMRYVSLPIIVMIRPRAGDFCYDDYEFHCMIDDIRLMKELGICGIVTGILSPNGDIDESRMIRLMQEAQGMEVVFHRAFDMSRNLSQSLDILEDLGVTRILTSGGCNKAIEGIDSIQQLIAQSRFTTIMPGSGIDEHNALQFYEAGATEIHLSGKHLIPSAMQYRKPTVSMGSFHSEREYLIEETSIDKVAAVRNLFNP